MCRRTIVCAMRNPFECCYKISSVSQLLMLSVFSMTTQYSYADENYPLHRIPAEHFSEVGPPASGFHLELQIQTARVRSRIELVDPDRKPVTCRSFVSKISLAEGELRKLNRLETAGGHLGWPNRCGFMLPGQISPRVEACFVDGMSTPHEAESSHFSFGVSYNLGEMLFNLELRPQKGAEELTLVVRYYCQLKKK